MVGITGERVFADAVRRAVDDLTDQFLNDFLTVNPK
jgi:hypothetical protein